MIPAWIQTVQGDLIPIAASPLLKISQVKASVVFYHSDGSTTNYDYGTEADALAALADFSAILEARYVGDPELTSNNPEAILQSTLPQTITVTGIAFDATMVIVLKNYSASTPLATTFINSTTATAIVPNTIGVGTYDTVYSDTNGKADVLTDSFIAY